MNAGLWLKAWREARGGTLLFGLGVMVFEVVIAGVLPSFSEQLSATVMQIPFLRTVVQALIGADFGESFGPLVVGSIAWVHPVLLALLAAQTIVFCTRLPVGEIDRGTIDVVLGWPVSRWQAYATETVAWVASGSYLMVMALLGNGLGSLLASEGYRAPLGPLLMVVANLFCLYLAVGGVAYLVSACSDRRGRAVGTVFAIVLVSFFLQMLGQFWTPAQAVGFLGVLHYYRPYEILQNGSVPWGDMSVLLAFGAVCWCAGGLIFQRRDICTT